MFNSIHVVSSWDFCGGLEIHDHDQKSAAALLPFLCHFVLGDFRQCILFSHSLLVHLSTLHKCALVWCILANCDSNYIQPYEYPSIATGVLSESHYGAKLYLACLACLSFVYTILFRPAVIAFLPTVSGSLQYFYLYQPACSSVQYPIPKNNNNNNTTDITISSAACIYRACLSHYKNSIHPSIRPSVGLSVYLACLLSSSSSSFSHPVTGHKGEPPVY